MGAGHWGGGGSRPARTYGNARTGRVFPGLSAVPVSLDFRFATIGHRAVSIRAAGPPYVSVDDAAPVDSLDAPLKAPDPLPRVEPKPARPQQK